MKVIIPIWIFMLLCALADGAGAQSTDPLFDSGGSTIIPGNAGPTGYDFSTSINDTASAAETYYAGFNVGNGSSTLPWGSGNTVTALNLSLWGFSPTTATQIFTVSLFLGTNSGSGLSGLTQIGSSETININNTAGGNYNNTASTLSFPVSGTTDPFPAGSELWVAITVPQGGSLNMATSALGGSPAPSYTFSNAFSGGSQDLLTYYYQGGAGSLGTLLSSNSDVDPFIDLTATFAPVPELPTGIYLWLSLPVIGLLGIRQRARSRRA